MFTTGGSVRKVGGCESAVGLPVLGRVTALSIKCIVTWLRNSLLEFLI